jgi:hypothetical protein
VDDVADVLPLDQHVGLADGVGLAVELLAVHGQAGVGVLLGQVILADREHAAGAGGRVVERADHAGLGQDASSSSMNSRLTISRMTSRGVKCSPAVSLEISANLRISSSNTRPI